LGIMRPPDGECRGWQRRTSFSSWLWAGFVWPADLTQESRFRYGSQRTEDMAMNATTFSFQIGAALVMGLLIGLERQWRQHTAGLRTNALVALGSALFVSLS